MIEIKVVRNVISNNVDLDDQLSRMHRSPSQESPKFSRFEKLKYLTNLTQIFQIWDFSQLRICRSPPPCPQFWSGFHGWCADVKIFFHTFYSAHSIMCWIECVKENFQYEHNPSNFKGSKNYFTESRRTGFDWLRWLEHDYWLV